MIVDARHEPTKLDVVMAELFRSTGRPFVVVANKLDKLKPREIEPNMARIRATLQLSEETKLIPFSAEKGTGRGDRVSELIKACE
jgi:GTP-binding protein